MEGIREFIIRKLFFLKVLDVDKPGVIFSKISDNFQSLKVNKRMVFCFEDIILELQKYTSEILGKEKSSYLWFEIGRELGMRQVAFSHFKKMNEKKKVESILKMFKMFRGSGASCLSNVRYSETDKSFTSVGENNVLCHRSGDPSFFAGVSSGMLTGIFGEDYEAIFDCSNCPNVCRTFCKPTGKKIEVEERLVRINKYKDFRFFKRVPNLKDFFKFKKVQVSSQGNWFFDEKRIMPFPHYFFDIVFDYYSREGLEDVYREGVIRGAENLFKDSFGGREVEISLVENLLSLFGWGVFQHKSSKEGITFDIFNPASNEKGILHAIYILNGYLNLLKGKKYKLGKIIFRKDLFRVVVSFVQH